MEHGGNLTLLAVRANCRPEELLDFSVNLNPLGPPPGAFGCYFRSFDELGAYPEPYAESLAAQLAEHWRLPAGRAVVPGNGSNPLLNLLPGLVGAKRALVVVPGYLEYEEACERAGLPVERFVLREAESFTLNPERLGAAVRPGDLVIVGNPGNPAGTFLPRAELELLIATHPEAWFLIDEAFIEFVGESESLIECALPNLAVSRSFTKFYAMPGLRMGAMAGPAPLMTKLRDGQGPWTVSTPAAAMMKFLLTLPGGEEGYASTSRRETARLREKLAAGLAGIPGMKVFQSRANYLLVKSPRTCLAEELLRKNRIALRDCSGYSGLESGFFRIAVRKEEDQAKLFAALAPRGGPRLGKPQRRTPALMVQGTCSNAGKSVLAAAFCRILLQDGFAVAPFKAQNMALNSCVTPDGGEIGRAQAVQAEACRLDPDVRMNPILLKPNSDLGSQLVLNGQAVGNFSVRDYFRRKPELWREVASAYDSLAADYEAIVLEGAGSPGEVNLKSSDLVNMRMAAYAQAQVLLAGDIDRGGVYASFAGTWATLEPCERKLVNGFIVNKFRGDASLLQGAHEWLEALTGRPVLGVIDFLPGLHLPQEDSAGFSLLRPVKKEAQTLDVVLVQLGHIANFTDVAPFELEPDVTIRKVECAADFGEPDAVILPGSKGVASDLARLRESGLERKIMQAAQRGAMIAGICGGLQLIGERLLDPDCVESPQREVRCFGLLPLETVMRKKKTLRRTNAHLPDGTEVSGYEIHYGETVSTSPGIPEMRDATGRAVGYVQGNCFATYLHGVFDGDRFRRAWLDRLRAAKGWAPKGGVTAHYDVEETLNRLADHVRSRIDVGRLYREMGLR